MVLSTWTACEVSSGCPRSSALTSSSPARSQRWMAASLRPCMVSAKGSSRRPAKETVAVGPDAPTASMAVARRTASRTKRVRGGRRRPWPRTAPRARRIPWWPGLSCRPGTLGQVGHLGRSRRQVGDEVVGGPARARRRCGRRGRLQCREKCHGFVHAAMVSEAGRAVWRESDNAVMASRRRRAPGARSEAGSGGFPVIGKNQAVTSPTDVPRPDVPRPR